MGAISAKEVSLMKRILIDLNETFPPQPIPIITWVNNKQVRTTTTQAQHFNAFKDYATNIWWLTCNECGRWQEAYDFMKQYAELFKRATKIVCHPIQTHPVYDAAQKRRFHSKKCFWIGKITWTEV